MSFKTQGIVIKRQNFSEADRILTVLTERFGKVKAIAKGVRRIHSHMAGALEPFILTNLQLHEGRNFYTVTGATIEEEFTSLHGDLGKMASAFYLGELIDKFENEHQKSVPVFELLVETLRGVNLFHPSGGIGLHLRVFEILLLKEAGFWGDLSSCLHCKEKLKPGRNYWDGEDGGIICGQCQQRFYHGRPVSDNLVKLFRLTEKIGFNLIERLNVPTELLSEAEAVLSGYIKGVLESDIRSQRFLKSVE